MWYPVTSPVGLLRVVNDKIEGAHDRDRSYLPDFSGASTLIGASDYSGEHTDSSHWVVTFVVTSSAQLPAWDLKRTLVRHQHRLDRRRMAYAKLGDGKKDRALREFLDAFAAIQAVICAVVVNKKITSIFDASGRIDLKDWGLEKWAHWKHAPFEKMLRVTHVGAFLFAGLASTAQNIIWVTDEDSIASNPQRFDELIKQFSHILDRSVTRRLGHIGCATTAGDTGTLDMEDLASVPDLIGGALADLFSALNARGTKVSEPLMLPQPAGLPRKTTRILSWLANRRRATLVYVVEPGKSPDVIEVTDTQISPRKGIYVRPLLVV